jgi:xanthine dehydrogenase accessory factor
VGLTCGGTIHVLVDPDLPAVYDDLRAALSSDEPVALATVVELDDPVDATGGGPALGDSLLVHDDGRTQGSLGDAVLDEVVRRDALGALAGGLSTTRHYGRRGEARQRAVGVFVEVFAPPPRMVIFGAVDFTAALARLGKLLGYHVAVCDARPVFATRARFPMADDVVADRPERYLASVATGLGQRDAVCVLTHDAKFDVPAIVSALGTKVGYLGAMGSRRTHADRLARLRAAGVDEDALARVMAPIGLDIGARTPEETAVAICAEIIALRMGRQVPFLRDASGPIHHAEVVEQSAARPAG